MCAAWQFKPAPPLPLTPLRSSDRRQDDILGVFTEHYPQNHKHNEASPLSSSRRQWHGLSGQRRPWPRHLETNLRRRRPTHPQVRLEHVRGLEIGREKSACFHGRGLGGCCADSHVVGFLGFAALHYIRSLGAVERPDWATEACFLLRWAKIDGIEEGVLSRVVFCPNIAAPAM